MARALRPGIFCLEGEWSSAPTDRKSVVPLLDTLNRVVEMPVVHHRVATPEEFAFHAKRLRQRRYDRYSIVYLAFHGSPGSIHLGSQPLSLEALGDLLEHACSGRVVHFGSCATADDANRMDDFRERIGATAVFGYREDIDWLESAAFDLLLFDALTNRSPASAERWMRKRHGDFCKRLGFSASLRRR